MDIGIAIGRDSCDDIVPKLDADINHTGDIDRKASEVPAKTRHGKGNVEMGRGGKAGAFY